MVTLAVLGYLVITILIGVYASRRVHGAADFMVAGRSLPLAMNFICVFATWFGAETVISVSATFARDGLSSIPGDPFGFSLCLVLVALFFARVFYRLNLLTIGDFYRQRYGKPVEVATSIVITLSYLGWAGAQLTALGLVLLVLGRGAGLSGLTLNQAIVIDRAYQELFAHADEREVQRILPELIMAKTPYWIQVMFLGALISAILSTASGTLLAPSSLMVENVLRPLTGRLNERNMLPVLCIVLVLFAVFAALQAINSSSTMYEMVQGACSVPLVGALVPLAMGIYWRRATTQGAAVSIVSGITVWLVVLFGVTDPLIPAQLWGLAASLIGMVIGSLVPQCISGPVWSGTPVATAVPD